MTLPNQLFFTGVPGSRWSGVAQNLEALSGVNTSDCSPSRTYSHGGFTGHRGSYFGPGMEFDCGIEKMEQPFLSQHLNSPWQTSKGMKILKCHEWAYKLEFIKQTFPNDWIMLVYRPDLESYTWWLQAGGFNISYPSYKEYKTTDRIYNDIRAENKAMLEFGYKYNATWKPFTSTWIEDTFGESVPADRGCPDMLVTVIK